MKPHIILASSSPFRKSLLTRLHFDFESISPEVDESLLTGENAETYVRRLAQAKASVIAEQYPQAIVIGSDQCALLDDEILGKPGNHERALQQLRQAQGKTVLFHTGLCVMQQVGDFCETDDILFEVVFRRLNDNQLNHYLQVEQPYNCAGSFKSEGYGVCLFEKMRGDDPTAIIGLPLIRLIAMLENAGVDIV